MLVGKKIDHESRADLPPLKEKKKPCKWYGYYSCPTVRYTEQGNLDRYWIENYCLVGNKKCVRYQMEEKGEFHPDNMLPDGKIRQDLT